MDNRMTCTECEVQLQRLMEGLTPAMIRRALRNTLNAEARRVGASVRTAIASMPIAHARQMKGNYKARARKDLQGFAVNVWNQGRRYMHETRRGQLKPIAFWAATGTSRGFGPYFSMEAISRREMPAAEKRIVQTFREKVTSQADKYGKL